MITCGHVIDDYDYLSMEELKSAIINREINAARQLFATKSQSIILSSAHDYNISSTNNVQEDALSQILIPDDLVPLEPNKRFVALKTKGDGNCLYNAASLCITCNSMIYKPLTI